MWNRVFCLTSPGNSIPVDFLLSSCQGEEQTSLSTRLALFIVTEAWLLTPYSYNRRRGFDSETNWQVNGTQCLPQKPHYHTWATAGRNTLLAFADRQALCTVNLVQLATRAERGGGRISILETTQSSSMFCIDGNTGGNGFLVQTTNNDTIWETFCISSAWNKWLDWLLTGGAGYQSDAAVDWVGGRPSGAPWERG